MEIVNEIKERVKGGGVLVKDDDGLVEWFCDLKQMTVFLYNPQIKYQYKSIIFQKLVNLINALKTCNEYHVMKSDLQFTFINVLLSNIKLGIGPSEFKMIYHQREIDKKLKISEGFSTLLVDLIRQSNKKQILNEKTLEGKLVETLKHFNIKNFDFFIGYFHWKIKALETRRNLEAITEEFMNLLGLVFENGKSFKFYRNVSIYLLEYYNEPNHHIGIIRNRLELRLHNTLYEINEKGVDRDGSRLDDIILFGARSDNDIKLDQPWGDFTFLIYYTDQYYLVPVRSSKQLWFKIDTGTAVEFYDSFRFMVNEFELKVEITKNVKFVLRKDDHKISQSNEIDWKSELRQFRTLEPFSNPIIGLQRKLIFFYSREQTRIRYFFYNLDAFLLLKCESLKLLPETSEKEYPYFNRRLNQTTKNKELKIPLLPQNIYQNFNSETYPPQPNIQSITLVVQKTSASPLELLFNKLNNHN